MTQWNLNIHDPSGEKRTIPLHGTTTLGRKEPCTVLLKDPTAPAESITVFPSSGRSVNPTLHMLQESPFWIKVPPQSPAIYLGDLQIREAQLPLGMPFQIGETKFTIEGTSPGASARIPYPTFPPGVRPWLTCSESGRNILWMAKKSASTSLSIYIEGETGTGKEVLAQLIHAWSDRKSRPFVPLHCGALPLSLVESELFGHTKGAFTGAVQHRAGALMQAHGGTLFLDEIGDLPLDIQVKLLRFLENGEIRPVGSDHSSRADVRIICATHHPLYKLVKAGKFRQDLYYRLASITLTLPSLRSRPEDIQLLANKFARELNRTLSPQAVLRLKAHTWRGNVRELRHAIERASGLSGEFSPLLRVEDFDFLLTPENIVEQPELELGASVIRLDEMERYALLKALKLSNGNRAKAAKILGVARSTLFGMLKRHQVVGPKAMLD